MVAPSETMPRVARLMPLDAVLRMVEAQVHAVAPQSVAVNAAFGGVLAADAVVAAALPAAALALRDGWAVRSDEVMDAGSYAPAPLAEKPAWVEAGAALPAGTDAVAPPDAVTCRGGMAEALAPVAPGDGVLLAGADAAAGTVLRHAGERLRRIDVAALTAAGLDRIAVRMPRVRIVRAGPADAVIDAAVDLVARAAESMGAMRLMPSGSTHDSLDDALRADDADAVVVIGGTGSGRRDDSVRALARHGRIAVHGIAVSPGETAAFGDVSRRAVLILPGRLDAALAVWLVLGVPILACLSGCTVSEAATEETLSRKVASALGLAEVVPVRRNGGTVERLASGYLSLSALAQADGWILVPAESEGYPAGTRVAVRPLP